jgi:hypothetical protein
MSGFAIRPLSGSPLWVVSASYMRGQERLTVLR